MKARGRSPTAVGAPPRCPRRSAPPPPDRRSDAAPPECRKETASPSRLSFRRNHFRRGDALLLVVRILGVLLLIGLRRTLRRILRGYHFRAVFDSICAEGYDTLAGLEAVDDLRARARARADLDVPFVRDGVGVHHEHLELLSLGDQGRQWH